MTSNTKENTKKIAKDNTSESNLSFEEALAKLESIIESMESGDIPLQELVGKFEEGDKLLKYCTQQLKGAELKIEKLKDSSSINSDNLDNPFEPFENNTE